MTKKRVIQAVILSVVILLSVGAYNVYGYYRSFKAIMETPVEAEKEEEESTEIIEKEPEPEPEPIPPATFLVYGIDTGEMPRGSFRSGRGRADTIILAKVNFEDKTVSALSIPRDTLVEIPGRSGDDKINHAYAFGGADLLVDSVEHFTGIEVDYYIGLNYRAFKEIVDRLEGIEFDVDRRIGSGSNRLEPGVQMLNGNEAYSLVTFRMEPMGDIARVNRQQRFIMAVARDVADKSLPTLVSIVSATWRYIDTNIKMRDSVELVGNMKGIKEENISMEVVPGWFYNRRGISYWKADAEETAQVIDQLFRHPKENMQLSSN